MSNPEIPSSSHTAPGAGAPPGSAPPLVATLPPPLAPNQPPSSAVRRLVALLLSLCLGLFLADAIISLVDDSLFLFFRIHLLTAIRAIVSLLSMLMAILIYFLIG